METKNKVIRAAIVIVIVIVVAGVLVKLFTPVPTVWKGPKPCNHGKCSTVVKDCVLQTGTCVDNYCQESLAGGSDCAPGWAKESTDGVTNQSIIATCDASCKWTSWRECGDRGEACCTMGKCSSNLACSSSLTCN